MASPASDSSCHDRQPPGRPCLRKALAARAIDVPELTLAAGDVLERQDDPSPRLYMIAHGRLRVTERDQGGRVVASRVIGANDVVGDVALLTACARCPATIEAETDAAVAVVSAEAFLDIARQEPAVITECVAASPARRARDRLLLAATRLVGLLDHESCTLIETCCEWLHVKAGSILCREEDGDRAIFLVLSGRLRAVKHDGRVLGEIGRGESIGELAALTGEPRSATVVAVRDCEVARLAYPHFQRLLERNPLVMQRLMALVVRRMRSRESGTTVTPSSQCIAVFPAHATAICRGFAARFAECLRAIGSTAHLRAPGAVGGTAMHDGVQQPEATSDLVTAWIDEQEATHRFVVFDTAGDKSPWTALGLRQADVILVVADANADPHPGPVEHELLAADRARVTAKQILVLLHDERVSLPGRTSRWRTGRRIDSFQHVRLDREADVERVARRTAGVATGVVFGGGGARGLAHIGVIRAFQEAGVAIDMVGGTSMGAVIGSALAMGYDWRDILALSKDGWLRRRPHREYTVPFMSLIGTRGLERWARHVYGETDIDDLWLDFFCVACNLTTGEPLVLDTGCLWRAVRASAALPGIFLPVLHDGHVLIDGGVVNNLPGDVARERGCRDVIVVDVSPKHVLPCDIETFPSAWGYFVNLLRPRARRQRIPGIVSTLMRLPVVSSAERVRRTKADADLCINPPVEEFGALEFKAIDRIVDAGYEHARRMIDSHEWRAP